MAKYVLDLWVSMKSLRWEVAGKFGKSYSCGVCDVFFKCTWEPKTAAIIASGHSTCMTDDTLFCRRSNKQRPVNNQARPVPVPVSVHHDYLAHSESGPVERKDLIVPTLPLT